MAVAAEDAGVAEVEVDREEVSEAEAVLEAAAEVKEDGAEAATEGAGA